MIHALATARASDPLDALERAITQRIREFEVPALLDLLASIGYGPESVEFRGHPSKGPQPTSIHAIEFPGRAQAMHAQPKVVVTVNLGLLSCRSPLPTYFQRFLADMDTREGVLELLELLDRSLLHTRLTCDQPERSVEGWRSIQYDFVRNFGLDSPIGLDWLFRQCFPELGVWARRITDERSLPFVGASLGASKLGECSFGKRTRVGVFEVEVVLICEDANFQAEIPWVAEGDRRLRAIVFPLLDEVCVTLTVSFILLDRGTRARLSPHSYAGYDPMWPPEAPARASDPPSRIELYRGALPRDEPDTAELERVLVGTPRAELGIDRYAPARAGAEPLGRAVELRLIYLAPGRRHVYRVRVLWGARAWYRDEPHAIALDCEDVPKTSPTSRDHPRLWARLREEARGRIADRLTHEIMATLESERVTVELVDRMIEAGELERLYALVGSKVAPMELWDDAAWRRFSSWSAEES